MKLVPLGDRVVLKQLVAEETTKSGIVIPGQSKEKPQQAEVIAVGIKNCDLSYASHQMTLQNATNITKEIHQCASQLFDQLWDGTPIRHLGIHTSRIKDQVNMRQLDLFDTNDYEKLEKMDETIDQIRKRYGNDSVMRAAFLGGCIDHMSGGISREKRSVDYEELKTE